MILLAEHSVTALSLPRVLHVGGGAVRELIPLLATFGLRRPLLVTDPWVSMQPFWQELVARLRDRGLLVGVFAGSVADPTTDSVAAAMAVLRCTEHDCVVGVGGGSAMDTAKVVAALGKARGPLRACKVPYEVPAGLPLVAIPTTAGTGAEATRFAVITDTETGEKMLLAGPGLLPLAALVDYELSLSMPPRLSADTGLDALCHALEAYVSRRANPFSDALALAALSTIGTALPAVWSDPGDRAARAAMMLAATQAGIAFSNSSVTLIHGMSRPLGALFHVPHGLGNAMLLTAVTQWSLPAAVVRYADCARAMGYARDGDAPPEAAAALLEGLESLVVQLEVPGPRSWGIGADAWRAAIPAMVGQAVASGSPANNPRRPEADDIARLYEQVLHSDGRAS